MLLLLAPSGLAHDPQVLGAQDLLAQAQSPYADLASWADDGFAEPLAGPWRGAESGAAPEGDYSIGFECPSVQEGSYRLLCPLYVLDEEDLMSQPVLMVDPADPDLIGFNALHGGHGVHSLPSDEPPTERSRSDAVHQPHTTFRTSDGGLKWSDMPYYAPDHLNGAGGTRDENGVPILPENPTEEEPREVYGEDNAAALDREGRLTIASLYAHRDGNPAGGDVAPFQYTVQTWKANRLNRDVDYFSNSRAINSGNDGLNTIESLHAVYVPETDLVAVMWLESVPKAGVVPELEEGPASQIRVFYTYPHEGAMWYEAQGDFIGPCRGISNPIVEGHEIYVGCFPDEGYAHASSYNLQMHAIDTYSWTTRHVAGTQVPPDFYALLVEDRTPGQMILVASGLSGNGNPEVVITRGEEGARWSSLQRVQDDLRPEEAATGEILDVRVTAAAVSPQSDHLHMVYMERYQISDTALGGTEAAYYKTLAAFDPGDRFRTKQTLDMGGQGWASLDPFLTGGPSEGAGVFNDLRDTLVIWTDPETGVQREFIGYGDHGYFRFAEVVESNFLFAFPIPSSPVPPIPAPAAGLNPATQAALAGSLSLAMLSRMLLAKKKVSTEAPEL